MQLESSPNLGGHGVARTAGATAASGASAARAGAACSWAPGDLQQAAHTRQARAIVRTMPPSYCRRGHACGEAHEPAALDAGARVSIGHLVLGLQLDLPVAFYSTDTPGRRVVYGPSEAF